MAFGLIARDYDRIDLLPQQRWDSIFGQMHAITINIFAASVLAPVTSKLTREHNCTAVLSMTPNRILRDATSKMSLTNTCRSKYLCIHQCLNHCYIPAMTAIEDCKLHRSFLLQLLPR